MKLIYTPVDGERQEFIFKPNELMSVEAEMLEDVGGPTWETYDELRQKFVSGNLKARRAVLWIMLRRQNPKLQFSHLVVRVDELDFDYDDDERQQLRDRIEKDPDFTAEERAEALEALGDLDAEPAEELAEPEGKDDSGDGTTDSESPQPDTDPSPSN